LRQMQADAEVHEGQRWKRLKKAADHDAKEASTVSANQFKGKNFLEDEKKSIFGTEKGGSTTIEESIRRRAYYSQVGRCRYPGDQVPPRTSSRSRQKARHANRTPLGVVNLGVNRMTQASSGAATCPAASAPAAWPGAAPGPSRVLRPQLPLPDSG
jgi:hypothetical protein